MRRKKMEGRGTGEWRRKRMCEEEEEGPIGYQFIQSTPNKKNCTAGKAMTVLFAFFLFLMGQGHTPPALLK
jgi:hypothetical protein